MQAYQNTRTGQSAYHPTPVFVNNTLYITCEMVFPCYVIRATFDRRITDWITVHYTFFANKSWGTQCFIWDVSCISAVFGVIWVIFNQPSKFVIINECEDVRSFALVILENHFRNRDLSTSLYKVYLTLSFSFRRLFLFAGN